MEEDFINRGWKGEVRNLFSGLIFGAAVYVIFGSWELTILIMAGLGVHELGHVLAIRHFKIPWEVGFSAAGAWTRTPEKERNRLSHFANAIIHLAGPAINLLYAMAAISIHVWIRPENDYWLRVANFSALLGLINMLPAGDLSDGGKFFQKLFSSVVQTDRRRFLWALLIWPFSLIWVMLLMQPEPAKIAPLIFAGAGLFTYLKNPGPAPSTPVLRSPKAMSRPQVLLMSLAMLVVITASAAVLFLTPFWLTVEQIWQMAINLFQGLIFLTAESGTALLVCLSLAGILLAYRFAGERLFQQSDN